MDSRPSPPPNSTQGPAPQDYGHGLSRSLVTTAYAVSILLFVIGTISIILRIYSRAVVVRLFGLDDWLMTSILVGLSVLWVATIVADERGIGLSFWATCYPHALLALWGGIVSLLFAVNGDPFN